MPQTLHIQDNGAVLVPLPNARPVPVDEWVDRQRTGRQLLDSETRLPLWEISCAIDLVRYDRREPELIKVRYPSENGSVPPGLFGRTAPEMPKAK